MMEKARGKEEEEVEWHDCDKLFVIISDSFLLQNSSLILHISFKFDFQSK